MLVLTLAAAVLAGSGGGSSKSRCQTNPEWHECQYWNYPAKNTEWRKKSNTCYQGGVQSPVNIAYDQSDAQAAGGAAKGLGNRAVDMFHYTNTIDIIKRSNNGHTLTVFFDMTGKDNYIEIGGDKYYLYQAHFHAGSENFIKGVQQELEVHFVHLNTDKYGAGYPFGPNLAVVGTFFHWGSMANNHAANTELLEAITAGPASTSNGEGSSTTPASGTTWTLGSSTTAQFLKVATASAFPYANFIGSLTTPPCNQGANWFVDMRKHVVAQATVNALTNKFFVAGWNTAHRSGATTAQAGGAFTRFTVQANHDIVETDGNFRAPQNMGFTAVNTDFRGSRNMKTYPVYYSDTMECTDDRDTTTGVCTAWTACDSGSATCPGYDLAHSGRTHADSGYNTVFSADGAFTEQFGFSNPTIAPTPAPSPAGIGGKDWFIGGMLVFFGCFGCFAGFVMYIAKGEYDKEAAEEKEKEAGGVEMAEA